MKKKKKKNKKQIGFSEEGLFSRRGISRCKKG